MRKLLLSILLALLSILCHAQDRSFTFHNYTVRDGLSQNTVIRILQDSKGYVWICTRDGLNRFDGSEFEILRSDNTENSLSSSDITSIVEDHDGILWISTHFGLNRYDPELKTFRHYLHEENNSFSISNNCLKHVLIDRKNRLWVGTINGLDLLDKQSGKFQHIYSGDPILWLIEESNGDICFVTQKGLHHINTADMEPKLRNIGSKINIFYIFEDSEKTMWLGTWNDGLKRIDKQSGTVVKANLTLPSGENFDGEQVSYIVETTESNLMIATRNGILIYDKYKDQLISHIKNDNSGNLNDNTVIALYQDRKHNIWVGTWGGGINVYSPYSNYFSVFSPKRNLNNPIGNINSMVEEDESIWLGSDDGLILFNKNTNEYRFHDIQTNGKNQTTAREIRYIRKESDNLMWVSVFANGLHLFDTRSKKIVKTLPNFEYSYVRNIVKQEDNKYWIATGTNDPLILYDITTNKYETEFEIKGSDRKFVPINVQDILIDSGCLWVGTRADGLYRYNYKTKELSQFMVGNNENSISNNHISTIFRDKSGNLWFGTFGGGICLYNRKNTTFKRFDQNNGLSNNAISGIIKCDNKTLWITTLVGVSKLDLETEKFENWGYNNGYPLLETNLHSCLETSDGMLIVGGKDMFISFRPSNLRKNPYIPDVYITKFMIWSDNLSKRDNNQNWVEPGSNIIKLKYNQTSFSLKFAALNYVFPENNSYAYMLEGFDKDWIYSGNTKSVSYTNIPSGKYVFRVKASNNDGVWNEQGASLVIVVRPPLWGTWWAYTFYIAIICAVILLFLRHRIREERLEADLKIKQAEKINLEENHKLRVRMFTNFSHELRTPLTLIIGPLTEILQKSDLQPTVRELLELINKNAHRLLWLVNQLMDFRKLESGNLKLRAFNDNFDEFITDVTISFKELAKSKDISLTLNNRHIGEELWYDSILLEKVFFNLLSNAFKHTPKGGNIKIDITDVSKTELEKIMSSEKFSIEHIQQGAILVHITDTGKGIPEKSIGKIFDPFFQAMENDFTNIYGTGIGLNLCKGIVDLHRGHIWVESEEGEGTIFSFVLPLGKEHIPKNNFAEEIEKEQNEVEEEVNAEDMVSDISSEQNKIGTTKKKRHTILVVEDNEDVRFYLQSLLKEEYNTITAEDCMAGCEIAEAEIPDLIISDIMTPRMNGIELCRRLKNEAITSHIPIILLTARSTFMQVKEGFESLADDYIVKPFNPDLLKIRVRNLLFNRENLRENFSKNFISYDIKRDMVSVEDKFMKKIFDFVKENIDNPDLSIDKLSDEMSISRVQLYRKIKSVTGIAPSKLILDMRLKMAGDLLRNTTMTVSEVAYKCGFNEVSYFGKCFKALYDMSPSAYQKH